MYFIGLISGTSVDGVDAVLVDLSAAQPRLIASHAEPMPLGLRRELLSLNQPGSDELNRLALLDNRVARLFAQAVDQLLDKADLTKDAVIAIGSHGQNVRHAPDLDDPYSVQIGNPSLLAELTGITTVADFRRRDVAAGGQGAPLAPAFHAAFFRDLSETRVAVNIGGIANLTVLPAEPKHAVSGFDTGPGNCLLDSWIECHLSQPYDADGGWAETGQVIPALLQALLADDYFQRMPPKSTGREYFNLDWVGRYLRDQKHAFAAQDVQATLLQLTAQSIAQAINNHAPTCQRLLICGGGVHNAALLKALTQTLSPMPVVSTAAYGVDPDTLEALGFAWLAQRTLAGLSGNLPAVTGARGERILGGIYQGRVRQP